MKKVIFFVIFLSIFLLFYSCIGSYYPTQPSHIYVDTLDSSSNRIPQIQCTLSKAGQGVIGTKFTDLSGQADFFIVQEMGDLISITIDDVDGTNNGGFFYSTNIVFNGAPGYNLEKQLIMQLSN